MDKTLGAEAGKQALGNPLLQVQVNRILGKYACILKNDWPDGCVAAPVGELLVLLARSTERVKSRRPARIGLCLAVEPRECPDWPACVVCPFLEPVGAEEFKRTGERVAKRRGLEAGPNT
jgi:hypothetical protein